MSPLHPAPPDPGNAMVAHTLHWLAVLLEIDEGPRERVEAWRQAAHLVRQLDQPVAGVARASGSAGLAALGIPPPIARMLTEWICTGELPLLEAQRQKGGLWPALARALCNTLGIPPRRRSTPPVIVAALELELMTRQLRIDELERQLAKVRRNARTLEERIIPGELAS